MECHRAPARFIYSLMTNCFHCCQPPQCLHRAPRFPRSPRATLSDPGTCTGSSCGPQKSLLPGRPKHRAHSRTQPALRGGGAEARSLRVPLGLSCKAATQGRGPCPVQSSGSHSTSSAAPGGGSRPTGSSAQGDREPPCLWPKPEWPWALCNGRNRKECSLGTLEQLPR